MDDGITSDRAISMSTAIVNGASQNEFCRTAAEHELWERLAAEIEQNRREGYGLGVPNP